MMCPVKAFALTSGPSMPEYNNFAPVDATDLVNLVSGDFSYSLPVMTVPGPGLGFPLVLGYRAGVLTKQEATWTGLGWNLQAGAITRQVNQIPDDFKGDEIKESIKTGSIHGWYGSISYDGVTIGLSWDNINGTGGMVGYSYSFSNGASIGGKVGFNGVYEGFGVTLGMSDGKSLGQSDLVVGGGYAVGLHSKDGAAVSGGVGISLKGPDGLIQHSTTMQTLASLGVGLSSTSGLNGAANLGIVASQQLSVKGKSHSSSTNITIPFYFYGYGELKWGEWANWVEGYGTNKYYGFIYEDKPGMGCQGNSGSGVNCTDNLNLVNKKMEFNGFKAAYPLPIASNAPSKPDYFAKLMAASPDVYSVETQGLAGVFRPNRKEDGEYLNNLESRRTSTLGECDVPIVSFFTQCTRHTDYNRTADLESTKDLHNQLGRTDDVYWRFQDDFGGAEYTNPDLHDNTAEVSVQSKKIHPYYDPQGKIRGFQIIKEDGVKYIYSFVLRNLKEMKLANEDGGAVDVATDQSIPAYAYAWLLTAIESPDYVDLRHAPGECDLDDSPCLPAEGDLGGWVLFSYGSGNAAGDNTGLEQVLDYNWRTPYIATPEQRFKFLPSPYIKGLDETESRLGHGTYDNGYIWAISNSASEGIKEIAYLMKIETPTHVARFKLTERLDGRQSAVTRVRRDQTEIVRDYANDRVYVFKSGLVQGAHHTVRIKYKVQIMRNRLEACSPAYTWEWGVDRNDFNSSNILLKSLDEGFIDRSGFKVDPVFYGNCLNAPGPELCREEGLRIEEFINQTIDVPATVTTCQIGTETRNCLVLFENDVKVAEPFNYSNPVENDELALPNSIGFNGDKSVNGYYADYCGQTRPSPHMDRYYAERQVEDVTFLSSVPVGAALKKLDGISLFSKLDETKELSAVQFKYDYSLVPGTPNSTAPGFGKLTLRSVRTGASTQGPWLPDYKFDYQGFNPPFQGTTARLEYETQTGWDRWGYHCSSCGRLAHEPDGTAAAWNLEQITMPSGGRIKVEYEPKLFHTTIVLDNGSIVPKDLTDRSGGSGFLPGATRTGDVTYESDIFPRPFKYPLGVNQGETILRNRVAELMVDAQQKGREIDHYDLRLRITNIRPPSSQQPGIQEHGFLLLTRRGVNGSPITSTNPPIIAMIPVTRAEMTSGSSSGQCGISSINCSLDKTISVTAADYEKIREIGFQISMFGYMPNPCLQPGHCAIGAFCAECHEQQGSGGYDDMVSWMTPRESGTWTNIRYDIQSWLTPRDSRIGGGVRVAKLSTIEPITGKTNAVQYTYGDGVTPTLPATFGTFDDRTLNNQPFLPLNVGYENFVGNPGVIYDKVSTVYTPGSGAPFRTDYHFVTAKDLPTRFSTPTKYEQTDEFTGSLDWTTTDHGVFIGAGMHSPSHIDLQAVNDVVLSRGYKVDDYIFELKFSAINQARRWFTSETQYVEDESALHCNLTMGNPNRFLMFSNFGDNVRAFNFTQPPQVASSSEQLLPIYPIYPLNVSPNPGGNCFDGVPPYQWPAVGSSMSYLAWNGTNVGISNGLIRVSIPARLIEHYRDETGVPTLRLDPRLVRKNNFNDPRTGYAVQDFHLEYKVKVVSSPANTARHYFRVTIQDYSSLWGNLWKKEDFAAGATTPIRTNLVKWGFNDGWISHAPNSSFASETRNGETIWTKRMADPGATRVIETYQEKNGEPFVKASVAANTRYFGMTQSLASYRYYGNNCDAESRYTNPCSQDNVVTTQTIHQRFLPHVMENTTIQDGLASTTHSTYYDFMTGAPLKTRTINSDQSVSDVYTQPAHLQYPDMAARNQLTQPYSTVHYAYPTNAPALTADPIAANAVAASYTRWRPYHSGGQAYPYRKSEEMVWRNKAYSGAPLASFSVPDDKCPSAALPDGTVGAPANRFCLDATSVLANWISSGKNSVYDPFGHVLEFIRPDGSKTAHMYSNGEALENAVAMRAGSGEIFHTSFEFERDLIPHYDWGGISTTFLLSESAAKTGSKGLLIQNSPDLENGVCLQVPPLLKGRQYSASVWYYDSRSGANPADPSALRAGISIGQPNGCHAEYFPDGYGGQPPVDPNQPSRATGSKTWKKLEVSFSCADPGYDPSQLRLCMYASRAGTGSGVLYDELRIQPKDAMMSTFTYDLHGNMVSTVDPNDLMTRYEYDAFGNLTGIRNDDGLLLGSSAQQLGRAGK